MAKKEETNRCAEIVQIPVEPTGSTLTRPQRTLGQVNSAIDMVKRAIETLDVSSGDIAPTVEDAMSGLITVQSQLLMAQMSLTRIVGVHARNFR